MEVERNRTCTIKQSDYLLEILTADLAKRYMLSTPVLSGTLEERKCDMAAARSHIGSYDGLMCACVEYGSGIKLNLTAIRSIKHQSIYK